MEDAMFRVKSAKISRIILSGDIRLLTYICNK